ncbi:MAG TPA: hypothetical protein VLY20_07360 [Nitrospiria bacterium]|nr:hypothetical protein [Nitrospiria bacterium]HUK56459.1 hypothetical protein [Nitrospiria bacterium]
MSAPPMDDGRLRLELRIYARRVTWVLVFIGGLLFIGGLRFANVDLDELGSSGKYFRPDRHICLKTEWLETTVGEKDRAQFCVEWLDPSDPSGNTHKLIVSDLVIVKDKDGKIHSQHKWKVNFPLIGTMLFLAFLLVIGKRVQKNLIERRRVRLGLEPSTNQSTGTPTTG